jgi:hypothetical protein
MPAVVTELLAEFLSLLGHAFWPDDITILDRRKSGSQSLHLIV